MDSFGEDVEEERTRQFEKNGRRGITTRDYTARTTRGIMSKEEEVGMDIFVIVDIMSGESFIEWNQGRHIMQPGEHAMCITGKTRQSLIKYEAQLRQATVMGLKRKMDEDIAGAIKGIEKVKTTRRLKQELRRQRGGAGKVRGAPEITAPGAQGGHTTSQVSDQDKTEGEYHCEAYETDHQEEKFEEMTHEASYDIYETDHQEEKFEEMTGDVNYDVYETNHGGGGKSSMR